MYECDICLAKIKKRNKNKHEKSSKHGLFLSNNIVNKYIVKKDDIDKFKDILQSYCDEHKKKFNKFTVMIVWKKNGMIINKISILRTITLQRTHMFKPDMIEIPIYVEVTERDFLEIVDRNCVYNTTSDEIDIKFVSGYKEMTLQHYCELPRSMLCRRLEQYYVEENDHDFEYNFLPKCFSHIGFQSPPPWFNILQPSPLGDMFMFAKVKVV